VLVTATVWSSYMDIFFAIEKLVLQQVEGFYICMCPVSRNRGLGGHGKKVCEKTVCDT
jgi:hypothetical protein